MDDQDIERELELAIAEGLIAENERAQFKLRALQQGNLPLQWLHREGILSDRSLTQLRRQLDDPEMISLTHRPENQAPGANEGDASQNHETLHFVENPTAKPEFASFPIAGLDRYRCVKCLGHGGMGQVYQAFDPYLRRHVAIKFLTNPQPAKIKRFLGEARAQAGVDHEHICKVHEVGELAGQPYIVMQFIRGEPLQETCSNLGLEQKLLLIQKVAEAVHQAHRVGLIHRDIKPGNIMVEQDEDGALKPFVLDFGLARSLTGPQLTQEGEVLGTPCYMAPEQARGETHSWDRRTDVYGLGATLYHLLVGLPPFPGTSSATVLVDVLEKEVKPPRKLDPSIPEDVQTIALKCLEKEPERRYDSARSLARDLELYLDGKPITAHPAGLGYRLRKKIRRQPAAFTLGLLTLILLVSFSFWTAYASWRSETRERQTRVFTERVDQMAAAVRFSRLARRHDISEDRRLLRRQMDEIAALMNQMGPLSEGPGNYALGEGYLALGDLRKARSHLRKAWDGDYRNPRVAYAQGLALSGLFQESLARTRLFPDTRERQQSVRNLETEFREPALAFMRKSTGSTLVSPGYVSALIAFHERRFDSALTQLRSLKQELPWFYEAQKLEGDVLRDRAWSMAEAGSDQQARRDFLAAMAGYERAADTAASDPEIYKAGCRTILMMMTMDMFGLEDMAPYLEKGLTQIQSALETLSSDGETWILKARLHRRMAEHLSHRGNDPLTHLKSAEDAAARAASMPDSASVANLELGRIYGRWAQWLGQKGRDPMAFLDKARSSLEKVPPDHRNYLFFHILGQVQMTRADRLGRSGETSLDGYRAAAKAFRQGSLIHENPYAFHNNLGVCLLRQAAFPTLQDPLPLLQQAIAAFERAIALNPAQIPPHYYLGSAYLKLAENGDPASGLLYPRDLDAAIIHFQSCLERNPNMPHAFSSLGLAAYVRAKHHWRRGRSPQPHFQEALAHLQRGIELNPRFLPSLQNLAWVYYYRAKFRLREGLPSDFGFCLAEQAAESALQLGEDLGAFLCLASVYRLMAEQALSKGRDPGPFFEAARDYFSRILKINPLYAEAHRSLGRLFTLEGRWLMRMAQDPEPAFLRAAKNLERAISLEPDSPYHVIAKGRLLLRQGTWARPHDRNAAGFLRRGLALLEPLLATQPDHAEANVLKGCFLKLLSRTGEKAHLVDEARLAFQRGLRANPYLAHEWSPLWSGK